MLHQLLRAVFVCFKGQPYKQLVTHRCQQHEGELFVTFLLRTASRILQ